MKRALITGITGQDGAYLSRFLLEKGYKVFGLYRRSSTNSFIRIQDLVDEKKITLIPGNLRDLDSIRQALEITFPDEIYNLAAQSDVGISFKCPVETMEVNYFGVGRILSESVKINPRIKFYQASTSEMFGKSNPPQNEESPFQPVSPYGESKVRSYEDFIKPYRKKGYFVCSGILFNHESPLRGENFVTKKITQSLVKLKLGKINYFELGNLEAKRDWGYAGDYVKAMWLMMQQKKPRDFVIATGKTHTVREFFEAAAKAVDIDFDWEGNGLKEIARNKKGKIILKINKEFYRPTEVDFLLGDNTKAKNELDWEPSIAFEELVSMMVNSDLRQY